MRPGDRVEITGIYKAMGVRVNSNKRTLKNVYRTYIDVITYVKADKKRYADTDGLNDEKDDNVQMKEEQGEEDAPEGGLVQDQGLDSNDKSQFTEQEIEEFTKFS